MDSKHVFSSATTRILPPVVASVIAFSLWKVIQFAWRNPPLRRLRGPKATSIILGNLGELMDDGDSEVAEKWVKEYGETLRFNGVFNMDQLLTMDTCAVNHILTHSDDYQKPSLIRRGLAEILGEGLLVAEGTHHRWQRRIMNPAFGPAQIRVLTETFLAKASHLRELWSSEIAKGSTATMTGTRIDVIPWLNKVTLDIIGLTGFNYHFNSLESGENSDRLSEAFSTMFSMTKSISIFIIILRALIPVLRLIPTANSRKINAAKHTTTQIGAELLANAKAAALADQTGKGGIEKSSLCGRDLLSLLVKANIATDIPDSQKLSDEDVIAQVPTFLFAGHETTSTTITWALYALSLAPETQRKLRDELLAIDVDTPSMDELIALPYLDAVVRETLRIHPPFPVFRRTAMKDDVLPVEKHYVDKHGSVRDTIAISKGDDVVVPIQLINRSKELWGSDAHEFKPERWSDVPEAVSRIPGIWGHMLTFLGGPRACIGYRFSIVEIKALLFSLIRAFEFELAVPASEIRSRVTIAQHPVLRNDPTLQAQLPLLIKQYQKV